MRTFVKENVHLTLFTVDPMTATLHFSTFFSLKKDHQIRMFSQAPSLSMVSDITQHTIPLSSALFFILKFEVVSQARNLTYEPPISINKPSHH